MSPSDFVSRGQSLLAAGQYQEAVKICRLGLLGRPSAVEGRVVLGQALLALRRYDEVLAEMRVALELDPNIAAAHHLKGEALLRKGDAVAAIEALARAKQLAPSDPLVSALLKEAELARDGAGGMGYVDLGDSMTKHYPSHQGSDGSGKSSSSFTKPTSLQKPTGHTPPGTKAPRAEEEPTLDPKPLRLRASSGRDRSDLTSHGVGPSRELDEHRIHTDAAADGLTLPFDRCQRVEQLADARLPSHQRRLTNRAISLRKRGLLRSIQQYVESRDSDRNRISPQRLSWS